MKEFYTRSITATAYAIVLLFPLFYNEYMFYLVGFICSLILVFEFIKLISKYNHKFLSRDSGKSNFILYMTFPLYISLFILSKNQIFEMIFLVVIVLTNIILGFMIATSFLSMWISNTATAVMILPIGMAIITQLKNNPSSIEKENYIFGKALMLAIAYSASIGGMATQIGTPPNLVFAGIIKETYGIEITFYQWLVFGLPISIFLLGICWLYLTKIAFKFKEQTLPGGRQEIETQLNLLGKTSYEEKLILSVFVLTALAWIIRPFVLSIYFPAVDDTIIAIISAIILFILPSKASKERLLNWEDIVKLPWGILLLFGGGMALAIGFETSGLANWIGLQLTSLGSIHLFLILLILISVVNFLTEITSNLATTAMLLPVLVSLASAVNIHPYYLLVGATLAASCAFMLPVATPPNAVVFGSKLLSIEDMVKKGLWMNLISIISLALIVYFILPLLWDVASPL